MLQPAPRRGQRAGQAGEVDQRDVYRHHLRSIDVARPLRQARRRGLEHTTVEPDADAAAGAGDVVPRTEVCAGPIRLQGRHCLCEGVEEAVRVRLLRRRVRDLVVVSRNGGKSSCQQYYYHRQYRTQGIWIMCLSSHCNKSSWECERLRKNEAESKRYVGNSGEQ